MRKSICPLCSEYADFFCEVSSVAYFRCQNCFGIFREKSKQLSHADEKEVYLQHNNDIEDSGYRAFVSPITASIVEDFTPSHKGLDFGAGSGPVITAVLQERGFDILAYDPYFHPDKALLKYKYDYIASCEVIEHFSNPKKEFALLYELLNNSAKLYLMTEPYSDDIEFTKWYYKSDPTHLFFYHKKTFEWIREMFGFSEVRVKKRLIVFSKLC